MKFISRTLVVLVLVCFSVPNVNEAQADRILLTMPAILASPNIIKDPPPSLSPPLPLFGTVVSAGGRVWMDRNLGASQVATSPTDSAAYGDLYQWGRGTDGHESRTSPTTTVLSSSDAPQHDKFIRALSSPFDWRDPRNSNLWQGVSGVNNPCPAGFRLPTETEWKIEYLAWSSNDTAGAFASPLKLVVAGRRFYGDGKVSLANSFAYYWSSTFSTVHVAESRYLYFSSGSASMYTHDRAFGFTVRCIQD